jgi:hypothetical protein
MMHVVKVNGKEYRFVNEGWSTSRSWGHKSSLYVNDLFVDSNKVTYINRTWESYRFRTCMIDLIWNLLDRKLKDFIDSMKSSNNIKRLSKDKRDEYETLFKENNPDLFEVLDKL